MKRSKQKHRVVQYALYGIGLIIGVGLLGWLGYYLHWQVFISSPVLPTPGLRDLALAQNVELGVLTYPRQLKEEPFVDVLTSQYSMLTSDGDIHWDSYRPAEDQYRFKPMDTIVDFAQENNMKVQGHHLIWDEEDSLPKWLKQGNYSQAQLLDIMQRHIATTVGRYKGKVSEWSVVNEPFTRAQHVYKQSAWWGDKFGGSFEYIDKAFQWAREADPQAKLILNDYNNETISKVSDAQYAYMLSAKERGVPIDGIGIEMHLDSTKPPKKEDLITNMKRFGELGYQVYITEFDINSSAFKGSEEDKAQLEARIASDVVRACVEAKNCVSFTVFGMTDLRSYKKIDFIKKRSLLLTRRFVPKPAFYAFRDAWQQP